VACAEVPFDRRGRRNHLRMIGADHTAQRQRKQTGVDAPWPEVLGQGVSS
jgi:hypothetical protein